LPLWGLEALTPSAKVMIHEGAKAARAVRQMLADGTAHPWADDLRGFVHLGWPGGSPNPHRVDWSPINAAHPELVVVTADNDNGGRAAVPKIARAIKMPMMMVQWDDTWPEKFDLADPFPENLFEQRRTG
jgi:hypothetical protein